VAGMLRRGSSTQQTTTPVRQWRPTRRTRRKTGVAARCPETTMPALRTWGQRRLGRRRWIGELDGAASAVALVPTKEGRSELQGGRGGLANGKLVW
jgi:hypothetical protein